jgi:cyclic 2,3-diphosphoglycerate synthetase
LADRAGLTQDLDEADDYDVLLTELKAAAVDVACERALGRGAEVVFVDNRVAAIEGQIDLDVALREVVEVVRQRGGDRH